MHLPNVDQLRSLVTVARSGSISAASDILHRSQSAISIQIKQLEEQMGVRLLSRHSRGVVLTREGEVVVGYASRVLSLLHELMQISDADLASGTVRFGMTEEYSVGRLPHLLRQFVEMQRTIEIEIVVAETARLEEHLNEGRIDLALGTTQYMSRAPHIRWKTPLLWVANKYLDLDRGKPLPLVLIGEGDRRWGWQVLATLEDAGVTWRQVYSTTTFASVFAAVEAGLGVTYLIGECLRPSLRVLGEADGLPPLPAIEFGLFCRDETPERSVLALVKVLQTALQLPYAAKDADA
ncbi:MAG: LysR substrate-binding domain-containing protein [Rhodobacteraceae bacterium]|nr:LysR substrate-binding domain-containing protein [Paracoccaceae bacterium]